MGHDQEQGEPREDESTEPPAGVARREMLKKTILGAGAAGVVWAAPTVKGLSLRPDYAAAASAGTPGSDPFSLNDVIFGPQSTTAGGGTVASTWDGTNQQLTVNFTGSTHCGFASVDGVVGTSCDDSYPSVDVQTANQIVVSGIVGFDDNFCSNGQIFGTVTCV